MNFISIAALDTETTGLNLNNEDDIIEIGIIKFRLYEDLTFKFLEEIRTLLKPRKKSFPHATKVHGIHYEDLINYEESQTYLGEWDFRKHHGCDCFLGQNIINFDNIGLLLPVNSLIDTLIIAKRMYPQSISAFPNYKNITLYENLNGNEIYKIDHNNLHSAITDCYVTISSFIQMVRDYELSLDDILNLRGKTPQFFKDFVPKRIQRINKKNENCEIINEVETKIEDKVEQNPILLEKVGFGKKYSETKWIDIPNNFLTDFLMSDDEYRCYAHTKDIETYKNVMNSSNFSINHLYTCLKVMQSRNLSTNKSRKFQAEFFKNNF